MGIFDRAREALGQAAAAVSRETEVLSLQSQLGGVDSELNQVLVEVGKRARELSRAGKLNDPEIEVIIRRVEELEAKMMELRQKVQDAQKPAAPPPPPAAVPPPPAPPAAEAGSACPRCGEAVAAGTKFCGHCGAKIE